MSMKSKKGPSKKIQEAPQPPQQQQTTSLFGNVAQKVTSFFGGNSQPQQQQSNSIFNAPQQQQMSNAQQQQFNNVQQQQMQFPVQQQIFQQAPIQSNQMQAQMQAQMQNFVPQQQYVSSSNNLFGGVYGRRPQQGRVASNQPQVFNDDEALIERVKEQKKDAKIDIEIKAQRSMAKLKEQVMLPAMVSLKTDGGSRTSVDLICVIDVSGSMSGEKIQLVKSTMRYLIQTLTPSDRLSIITFENWGQRLCGLKCVTPENLISFNEHINSLSGRGGTNICSGLDLAVKTIKERKHVNKVTSVFLLSDGQDKGAEANFKNTLKENQKQLGNFSIHSFGFGTDHDEDLMTKICQMRDGSFYFIKELATLDEAFCNALGGIISLVATDVIIKLNNISKNIVEGVKVKKTYGEMWEKINDKEFRIKILQLMSGISKDYVFEILIPNINTQVGDLDRDHDILQALYTAKGVDGKQMSGECVYKITLLNENQQIPEVNQNIDVIQNHLRVAAAQAIQQNMKKAQQNNFDQAQKGIDSMINYIQSNKKARKDKMEVLVNDLQQIRQKCSKQDYQQEGKKWMKSAQIAHLQQNNYAYSNCVQTQMVQEQKMKKAKY